MTAVTTHAQDQAQAKGWDLHAIDATVRRPDITYPSGPKHPGQERRIRVDLGLCVVVDVARDLVITVYQHLASTPLRSDQQAQGARAHA